MEKDTKKTAWLVASWLGRVRAAAAVTAAVEKGESVMVKLFCRWRKFSPWSSELEVVFTCFNFATRQVVSQQSDIVAQPPVDAGGGGSEQW